MGFVIYGTHLDREVHAAGDLLDLVPNQIDSYVQTPQMKGEDKGSRRVSNTSTKTTFTTKSATVQGTSRRIK